SLRTREQSLSVSSYFPDPEIDPVRLHQSPNQPPHHWLLRAPPSLLIMLLLPSLILLIQIDKSF
uniref:Uncharacterized protein n=1 Tax=Brassica oleracea var. oleracea TaxID=109376 RepID=A0A0D3DNX5_BRAOL